MAKAYGPIQALDDVSLTLRAGEVHCVAGENGAGKSTLIKILTGAIERDSGEYLVNSHPLARLTPSIARNAGVGVVYQELSLLPDLSVAENLLMSCLPARNWVTRPRERRRRAAEMLEPVELAHLDPDTVVRDVPLATQQLVEIAKVLGQRPKVVIFDEPTTALSASETAALLEQIRRLRSEGHALWVFVLVIVIVGVVLRRTVFGRYVYAVGSNPESARLAGVPVTRVLISAYAVSGLLAPVGGVLFASRLTAGIPPPATATSSTPSPPA